MANTKLSDLTSATSWATGDLAMIVDVSDTTMAASGTNKKITLANLFASIPQHPVAITNSDGGTIQLKVENTNTGISALSQIAISNSANSAFMSVYSTGHTGSRLGSAFGTVGSMELDVSNLTNGLLVNGEFMTGLGGAPSITSALTEVVINDNGIASRDFRVEGDTETHLLFCDASTDRVGIGTGSPAAELDVNGEINVEGGRIRFGAAVTNLISPDTSDTADSAFMGVAGGGGLSSSRGAYAIFYGNEHASRPGELLIAAGDGGNADIDINAGAVDVSDNLDVGAKLSAAGNVDFTGLPTSDPAVAGRLWNDSGTLKVSAG